MIRVLVAISLVLAVISTSLVAQPPKGKAPQKKDTPPKEKQDKGGPPAKEARPAVGKEFTGMFKSKDLEKKTITLTIDGKDKVFKITDSTKFVGPRGAVNDDKLKDDRLDKGYKIVVIADPKDVGVAAEVKLPFRNERASEKKSDEKKRA